MRQALYIMKLSVNGFLFHLTWFPRYHRVSITGYADFAKKSHLSPLNQRLSREIDVSPGHRFKQGVPKRK